MKAMILAGGLGTRLRGLLPDLPKPLAPVGGRPFLEYLILQLRAHGIEQIVLSTGHLASVVEGAIGDGSSLGVEVEYSREDQPLGTGGALRLARPLLDGGPFLVMNGDSFLDVDLQGLVAAHRDRDAVATLALARVEDTARYGRVELDANHRITDFVEKGVVSGAGWINGGVYVLSPAVFDAFPSGEGACSLEKQVFPRLLGLEFLGVPVEGFFRDIGVPEDYRAMCDDPEPLRVAVAMREEPTE